ncbi:hypothetical protein [Franconibacter pulveris]|uniref:hypothetical protein n=1 Tax=Franconibacter pulveris TaxID=435910 RepID=UPI000497DD07|nr:hypothetical protein [Franconibacter pulveris]
MAQLALNKPHWVKRWAIRLSKVLFFILLFVAVGRTLGNPYNWVNHSSADKLATFIYGYGHVGGEEIDNTYFYIDVLAVITITIVIYLITMKLIRKIRSK